jgi:hypothetical protein
MPGAKGDVNHIKRLSFKIKEAFTSAKLANIRPELSLENLSAESTVRLYHQQLLINTEDNGGIFSGDIWCYLMIWCYLIPEHDLCV